MIYEYTKLTAPNMDNIHIEVAASVMTDKSINYCIWTKNNETLKVIFYSELSSGDKTILDGIVVNA